MTNLTVFWQSVAGRCEWGGHSGPYGPCHPHPVGQVPVGVVPSVPRLAA